ncbi:MAG: hypothetical protein IJS67_05485 [Clostridia bacterium]|nr:hypothetical protein [Clostridia bacterium]
MDRRQLKTILKEKHLTYRDLSDKSGVGIDTIKKYMAGQTRTMRKLNETAIINALNDFVEAPSFDLPYLSEQEEKIIKLYRKLPDTKKRSLYEMACFLADEKER